MSMRKGVAGLLLACATLYAGPCAPDTLQNYINLLSTGCVVGGIYTYHDFSFGVVSSVGSPTLVTPAQINVNLPIIPALFGLRYASSGFSLSSGQSVQYLLTYIVDPLPPIIWDFDLEMETDPPHAPGFANISSLSCIGAAFIGNFCPTTTVTNFVFDNGGTNFNHKDLEFFASPTSIVGNRTTITLNALAGGDASFTTMTGAAGVPEPGSIGLAMVGLLVVWLRARQFGLEPRQVALKFLTGAGGGGRRPG